MMILLMSGCSLLNPSPPPTKIPYFISKLKAHSFTTKEKETIAEILRYVNELEHDTK